MLEVELKTTEPATTAFIQMRGPYDQIPVAMGRLYGWVQQRGLEPMGMPSGVYLTAPGSTPESDAQWELRAPVAGEPAPVDPDESGCGVKPVPPRLVASTMHRGPYEAIGPTYEALGRWVAENGYAIIGPPEELYYSDPETTPPEEYLTEIRFSVAAQ